MDSFEVDEFAGLSREKVLGLPTKKKKEYLKALQVRHRRLGQTAMSVLELLDPDNEVSILSLIGATGVGKSVLSSRLLKFLIEQHSKEPNKDNSTIPFIYVELRANGNRTIPWIRLFEDILKQGCEPLIAKKRRPFIKNNKVHILPARRSLLEALRDAVESMVKHRKVKVLVIDEAFHLLRFGDYTSVMDTLKSLVNSTGLKIILIGSYDIFDLVTDYGQVARRGEIIHFKRYHRRNKADAKEFKEIIAKFQERWPSEQAPNFVAIHEELMEASLGCVGLLKAILTQALNLQLRAKGKWDPIMIVKSTKSVKLINKIRQEIVLGERKVKGSTYGESFFNVAALHKIVEKMSS